MKILPGSPLPLGVHVCCEGTNFSVFSRHARCVVLCVFDDFDSWEPTQFTLQPPTHRTGDIWHALIPADLTGCAYGYQVIAEEPIPAYRNVAREMVLLDPYARLVIPRSRLRGPPEHAPSGDRQDPRFASLITGGQFDWQRIQRPRHSWAETIIYETHVRGFSVHATSGAENRGRYLGIVERIPYLKSLGITAIELLPVQTFATAATMRADDGSNMEDYWGYNPIAFFSPHAEYASASVPDAAIMEFKTMVRELHRAGIEIILDVVFNHTGEAGPRGRTSSFRGLDESIYYLLAPNGIDYLDFTGCGNTLNCNHPVVRRMILDCLRYWVVEMKIDGFRFDLAAVLGRGPDGSVLQNAPILEEIAEDPLLRDVKLIAEAWDAGGAFMVGGFAGPRWGEWNCHFRDDVRRFWRGDSGFSGKLASRLCGSADLYEHEGRSPLKSINFITSHDGFTLQDLVSYAVKHNEANGESNRDGMNENHSSNYGSEGNTSNAATLELRRRQVKNMLATLLLSRGVPMLLGGDEFGRTQQGNNNAWCQDNEVAWYDWRLAEENAGRLRFVQRMIELRQAYPALRADRFYTAEEITWLGPDGSDPDWNGPNNRVGCIIACVPNDLALFFNATPRACQFSLPGKPWRVLLDTSCESPNDVPEESQSRALADAVTVAARSLMLLRSG